jgi:hypothetical protein
MTTRLQQVFQGLTYAQAKAIGELISGAVEDWDTHGDPDSRDHAEWQAQAETLRPLVEAVDAAYASLAEEAR